MTAQCANLELAPLVVPFHAPLPMLCHLMVVLARDVAVLHCLP